MKPQTVLILSPVLLGHMPPYMSPASRRHRYDIIQFVMWCHLLDSSGTTPQWDLRANDLTL